MEKRDCSCERKREKNVRPLMIINFMLVVWGVIARKMEKRAGKRATLREPFPRRLQLPVDGWYARWQLNAVWRAQNTEN